MARSSGNNFPFHLKSLYSSYHYGFSFLLMTTRTIFIKTKHLITIVACTGSNNLSKNMLNNSSGVWTIILRQEAPCFQWSLFRFHWMVCPVTWRRGVGPFGTLFWEKLQHSWYLGVLDMTEISLTHRNSHLKAEPLVIQISKTSLYWSSANLLLLGMWLWDFIEWKRN